jgi:multiple sugar transport system substrate-binding protein
MSSAAPRQERPMHRKSRRSVVALLFSLSALAILPGFAQSQPVIIRMAGDEWFLDSLTKTGMLPDFEKQSGIHVEALHKNDRTIMAELDRGPASADDRLDVLVMRHRLLGALIQKGQLRPIDSLVADPTLHDAGFKPEQY